MSGFTPHGFGWQRDLPDLRDDRPKRREIRALLDGLPSQDALPPRVDWREFFAAPVDQGPLPTSTAHAVVGLVQYFERRATGRDLDPSRLFLHRTTRALLGHPPESDASLRATFKALVRLGTPPERFWPYDAAGLGREPSAFAFAAADRFDGLRYLRLGGLGKSKGVLRSVRSFLAAGFACAFGVPVYTCLGEDEEMAYPTIFHSLRGGQALVAAGYDDQRRLAAGKGALLIRNSWGADWGDGGYGWMPYAYVEQRLAVDFWTLIRPAWLDPHEFYRPA